MKANLWAAPAVVLVVGLGGCTAEEKPNPGPSAAPVVQEEQVPMGNYRRPKDGEVCKKLDAAPLQAVVPGIALGPATGVFQGKLKCDFTVSAPSMVSVSLYAAVYDSPEQAAKERDTAANSSNAGGRTITLPVSKAESVVTGANVGVLEQNLVLYTSAFATDKAVLTDRVGEAVQRMVDDFLVLLRKDYQSTTGPSPSVQLRQPKVVSPDAVRGRQMSYAAPYDKITFALRGDLESLDASPTVASAYGTAKDNNVLIFAATLAVNKPDAQIDAILTRLAREGITMSKPATEKLDEWTGIRCGEGKFMEFTGALCLWRDKESIGVAAYVGQKPADVKDEFLALRKLAITG